MLRFFRKFRQRLLSSGKLRNYLLYAAGEIILVMIGILLAIQVNNWNEQRKAQKELDLLFQNTQEFLDPIKTWTSGLVDDLVKQDSLISVLISGDITPGTLQEHPELRQLGFEGFFKNKLKKYYWVSPGMETLIDRKTDFTDAQKPLIYTLETWDVIGRELESVSADLFREASNYRNYVITHAPYLAKKDSANVENTVNFVRNDVGYKNSLMVLQNLLQNLINVVNWGMATYAELNVELDLLKNDLTAEKVDTFFTRCGLEPITIMGCKEQVESISLDTDINSWQVIYNDSDEKIDVSIIDNGRVTQRTRPYRPGMVGSMRVSAGNVIQVDAPDTCSVIYLPVSGGYLVIK